MCPYMLAYQYPLSGMPQNSQGSLLILRPTNQGNGTRIVWWRITRAAAAAAARVVRKLGEGVLPSQGVDGTDLHATGSVLLDLGREVFEESLLRTNSVSELPNLQFLFKGPSIASDWGSTTRLEIGMSFFGQREGAVLVLPTAVEPPVQPAVADIQCCILPVVFIPRESREVQRPTNGHGKLVEQPQSLGTLDPVVARAPRPLVRGLLSAPWQWGEHWLLPRVHAEANEGWEIG